MPQARALKSRLENDFFTISFTGHFIVYPCPSLYSHLSTPPLFRCGIIINKMGNSNPTPSSHKYTELRIEQNELLSSLLIVQDPVSRQRLMLKQLSIASQQEFARVLRELRARKALSGKRIGQFLIQIREIETRETNEICGKNYRIGLYMEYLEGTLKQAFVERQRAHRGFSEQEVKELMRTMVSCLIVLHDNNYRNVHIYKEAIFRTEDGGYKLADTQLSNRIHPYFQLLNNVPTKKGTYLAPELLAEIRQNNTDFFHTPKADIFTLAVLAMELLTLSSFDQYYDYEKMHVDLGGLRAAVEELQCSGELKSMLELMLLEQQQERIGLLSLKEILSGSQARSEQSAFRSATATQARKNTTRTFISRSKPESRASKHTSVQKMNTEQTARKEERDEIRLKDFPTQRQRRIDHQSLSLPHNYVSNHVIYQPIEVAQVFTEQQLIPTVAHHQHQHHHQNSVYEVRQTPRASLDYDPHGLISNRLKRQFQTPVNMLYQQSSHHQPESTPIRNVELLNSLQQPSIGHQQTINQPPLQPNTTTSNFSTDYFGSKNYGQHLFSNGAKYEGEFNAKNEFDGNGMLYYPGGKLCYSGSWQANSFHGFGVLYNECPTEAPTNYDNFNFLDKNTWDHYEGEFDNDRKEGFGTLYFVNGDKFSGCFKDDAVEGFGTFFLAAEGKHVNGIWAHNVLKH